MHPARFVVQHLRIDHLHVDPHQPKRGCFCTMVTVDGTRLTLLTIEPGGVYNLAAQSHVRVRLRRTRAPVTPPAWDPCDCWKPFKLSRLHCRFYPGVLVRNVWRLAATAGELTPFLPRSPYGAARSGVMLGDAIIAKRTVVRR